MDDIQLIKEAAELYASFWNNHDASRFRELFAEDADFCTFQGIYISGREAIQKAHQFIFDGPFKNTILKHVKVIPNLRSSEFAVYRSEWEMTGNNADNTPMETRGGMFIFVLQKIEGNWKIIAGQNTDSAEEKIYKA